MKRQVHTRLPGNDSLLKAATSVELSNGAVKPNPVKMSQSSSMASGDTPSLRKHSSVDGSKSVQATINRALVKPASFDTGSPFRRTAPGKTSPMPVGGNKTKQNQANVGGESKAMYHTISADLLSKSPLQPSPSMSLLNRAAEVLTGDQGSAGMRRMPVRTTTQVFEVRKPPGPATKLSRQESLLAVFKPATDEDDSLLVKSESSFRFNAEERALRERAAYVLDKCYQGFSRVPATALAHIQNSNGSLQEFIRSNGTAEDNPELVGKASIEEVQRIAILDCRIFNLDRHAGNVLVSTSMRDKSLEDESFFAIGEDLGGGAIDDEGVVLTPIDHSLSLPPWTKLDAAWFDWSYWPQAEQELTKATRDHIKSLDRSADEAHLRELGIRPECIATNSICTLALQALIRSSPHLTLKAVASFFQRPYSVGHRMHDDVESPLEHIVEEACIKAGVGKEAKYPSPAFFLALESVLNDQIRSGDWMAYLV
jgi:hypothetical protein